MDELKSLFVLYLTRLYYLLLVTVDLTTAKELLVLANSPEEQKEWVTGLSSKIIRKNPQQKKNSPK